MGPASIEKRARAGCALGLGTVVLLGALVAWVRLGPLPGGLFEPAKPSTVVVDRNGVPLYEARAADGTRGAPLTAATLPDALVHATLAAEDRRFFHHPGVDPVALGRAAVHNLIALRRIEGGSTISQQVAKLLLARRDARRGAHGEAGSTYARARPTNGDARVGRGRSWATKLREALVAVRLEHRFDKRQLLFLYLNLAPYGNQIVGVDAASRIYFGCAPSLLTPAQAAFLAGLPQRPSGFNPYRQPAAALRRERQLVARMHASGWLTATQAREARAERVMLVRDPPAWLAPHFVEAVLAHAGGDRPARIQTTLDAALQREVQGIVRAERSRLEAHGAHNVAVAVLDNASSGWLAWEGSGDYFDTVHGGAIDGVLVPRQPGSALKPFTYAAAFDRGYSPATVLPDVPSHFPTAEPGVIYVPRNYDGRYRGPLRARLALAGSENVPAVAVAADIGVPSLLRLLRRGGVTTFEKTAAFYGLGATLGDAEVSLGELVAAYAMFARGGIWMAPHSVLGRERPVGRVGPLVEEREPVRAISERSAFWVTDILSDNEAREYAFGRGGSLEFPFPVAVKTGTSQGYHDNWTIGFTGSVTVGVWVGNFDRRPLRDSSGVTGAGPIFHAVMLAAMKRSASNAAEAAAAGAAPILEAPAGVVRTRVCSLSGMRATPWCPAKTLEWTAAETSAVPCSWHQRTDSGVVTVWPPEYRAWALNRAGGSGGPSGASGAGRLDLPGTGTEAPRRFAIAYPPPGAIYLIDPTLRREFQTLPLRTAGGTGERVDFMVDGHAVGSTAAERALMWPLAKGTHQVVAQDTTGAKAQVQIVVR